jgi:hypothetical protein
VCVCVCVCVCVKEWTTNAGVIAFRQVRVGRREPIRAQGLSFNYSRVLVACGGVRDGRR